MLNLNVSLSQQRVIAIRHGIVELHPELQALGAVSLVQHYTALNQHCAVLHTGSVQNITLYCTQPTLCRVTYTVRTEHHIILHSTNTVPCYIQGPYRTSQVVFQDFPARSMACKSTSFFLKHSQCYLHGTLLICYGTLYKLSCHFASKLLFFL